MAMDPQKKSALTMFTTAAKVIVYDAKRMEQFLPLMETKDGAIKAVQAVISVIETKRPIPPDVVPLLSVNVYMLLVDMAREITGMEPDPAVVKGVIGQLLATMQQSHSEQGETPMQEQEEPPAMEQEEEMAGTEMPMGIMGRRA